MLAEYDAGRIDLTCFRGRSSFTLVEQAAEHFVRAEFALDALDAIASIESLGDGQVAVQLADGVRGGGDKSIVVTVEKARLPAPTPLTCKGAEGLTYPEFRLVAIEPRA